MEGGDDQRTEDEEVWEADLVNRSPLSEVICVMWILTMRFPTEVVRYTAMQYANVLYKLTPYYRYEGLFRLAPWLAVAFGLFLDRDLPHRKVRSCPLYALTWTMVMLMNISCK